MIDDKTQHKRRMLRFHSSGTEMRVGFFPPGNFLDTPPGRLLKSNGEPLRSSR